MKKKITLVSAFLIYSIASFGTTWTVIAVGSFPNFRYSPDSITITRGDTVVFNLASFHSALEVSQASWIAQVVVALPGGFHVPFGGGTLLTDTLPLGMHYYLCENHGPNGMKGIINILTSGVNQLSGSHNRFSIYPNPCVEKSIQVSYHVDHTADVAITIYNLLGKEAAQVLSNMQTPGDYLIGYEIDRSHINAGIYILELMVDNKRSVQKLVIQ